MKPLTIVILLIQLLILSCEKDTTDISGSVTYFSDCKSLKHSSHARADVPDTLDCIYYSFITRGSLLSLEHINAAFNCCPGTIYCEVRQCGDTLVIEEFEEAPRCDCCCLYDINIEVRGIDAEVSYLKIIEPYAGEKERMVFKVDLRQDQTGSHCVTRDRYPWGMGSGQ